MFNRKVRVGRGEGGRGHYHNQRREGGGDYNQTLTVPDSWGDVKQQV